LLILDEPIQGLDPVQIVEMRELIRTLRGEHTILLSSHILEEIERTCDRVLMLHQGRIVEQGAVSDAREVHVAELEVRASEEDLRAALAAVEEPTITALAPVEVGVLRATVRTPSDAREAIAAQVIGRGLGLRRLERGSTELEDVFLRLSKDEEARA